MVRTAEQWTTNRIEGVMERFEREAAGDDRFFERIAPALGCHFDSTGERRVIERDEMKPLRDGTKRNRCSVASSGGREVVMYRFSFA